VPLIQNGYFSWRCRAVSHFLNNVLPESFTVHRIFDINQIIALGRLIPFPRLIGTLPNNFPLLAPLLGYLPLMLSLRPEEVEFRLHTFLGALVFQALLFELHRDKLALRLNLLPLQGCLGRDRAQIALGCGRKGGP